MATVYTRASKGSALTWAEGDANINNLNNAKIENVVDDTTPQLGGNLDVNGNSIVSASNGNINITPNGTGSVVIDGNSFPQAIGASGEVLTADGAGAVEWKLNQTISAQVYNADSVQINKGEPVYVFGAQGSNISVKRALNTGDATSAQTLGLANENIAAGATGIVICQGILKNVDTSSYTAGQALYLGATAGAITTTKPKAPNHLVYLGFAETINSVSGRIYVRVQNGYELDEIHDVQITTTPSNGQVLAYESSSSLWKPTTITAGATTLDGLSDVDTTGVSNGQVLYYDGPTSTWKTVNPTSGLSAVQDDPFPTLGGDLRVNGKSIISASGSNGNIVITPDGTGKIQLDGLYWPTADGTNNQVLKTDGAGNLSWTTVSATPAGSNQQIQFNNSGSFGASSSLVYDGTSFKCSSGNIESLYSNGDEGGEFRLATATTNTTLAGGSVAIDINQNRLRIFEVGGNNRGVYIDLAAASNGVGTNLVSSGISDIVQDTTPQLGGNLDVNGQQIVSVSNGNIVLAPNGTGKSKINNINYFETPYSLGTTSGTITPDVANGNVQTITLNGNLTFSAFSNPVSGQSLTLIVNTGGTSRTLTSTMKFAGGEKTISTTSTTDIISVFYDGTNYWASLSKDFK